MSYPDKLLNSLGNLLSDTLNRRIFLVSEPHNGLARIIFHDGKKILFCGTFHESEIFSPTFKDKVLMEAQMSAEPFNFSYLQKPPTQRRIFLRRQLDR